MIEAMIAPGIVSYPLRRYLLNESRGKRREYWPYQYVAEFENFNAAALNTDLVVSVPVETDAPFLWLATLGYDINPAGGGDHLSNSTLMVRIGGPGGKAWARTAPAWKNCLGYRPEPARLPAPWLVAAGSEFHVTLRKQAAQTQTTVFVNFLGLKVYGWGPNGAA